MNRWLPSLALAIAFLAMLALPPLVQTVVEVRQGQRPRFLELFKQSPRPAHLRSFEKDLQNASVTANWLRPWVQAAQFLWLRDAGEKALIGRNGWLFYQPGVSYLTQRATAKDSIPTDAFVAVRSFRDSLSARGIRLILLPVPNKESIYPEKLAPFSDVPTTIRGPEVRRFITECQAAGIEWVDLFSLFERYRQTSPGPLYLAQDSHWSSQGLALAATAVAERIQQEIGSSPANGQAGQFTEGNFDSRPAEVDRYGDLIRMLRSPPLEKGLAPERAVCARVFERTTNAPYVDDPQSDVLVIGDSFLRIFETDEPGSAGFLAQLSLRLGRPVSSIVNDGGGSTLVRQDLARRSHLLKSSKVVVWEFTERDLRLGLEGWQIVPIPAAREGS